MTVLRKYLQIFKISWQDSFVYRLNFLFFRLRVVVWILASYFFWLAVYQTRDWVGNYTQETMFTYILGSFLFSELILNSLSINIGQEISTGNVSNFLLKPVNYFSYWFTRDWSNKLLSSTFSLIEVSLFFLIFKPSLFLNKNLNIPVFILIIIAASILNFYLELLISLVSFWFPEHGGWPQRFLADILLTFFAGLYFPFDIFPKFLSTILQILPTGYLLYFPLQVYLGRMDKQRFFLGMLMMIFWIIILAGLAKKIWSFGLKKYASEGR